MPNDHLLSAAGETVESPGILRWTTSRAISPQAQRYLHDGLSCLQTGNAAEAVVLLSKSIEHAPEFPEAHVFLGIAHALTSNVYPAIDHLEIATKLDPESFAAHYALAQLSFKLRTLHRGYEQAEQALRCPMTLEQRKMLTQLLREERARERNGIARPLFDKPFSRPAILLVSSGLAAAVVAVVAHLH